MCKVLVLILILAPIIGASGCTNPDMQLRADISQDPEGNSEVTLQNSILRARYAIGPGGRKGKEWAIRDLIIKDAREDQAGRYIDACATRGFLTNASVIRDEADVKTVRLRFDDGCVQDVSIFPHAPYLRINYLNYGVNVVDIGAPGGGPGEYEIYGAEGWHRGYEAYPYSYYNRYAGDVGTENVEGVDPEDAASLNYKGYFIMGVYNPTNGRGFGRVAAVRDISIIKLLHNRGFELFPHFRRRKEPYTGYLYVVTGGAGDVISTGKHIVDEVICCEQR